MTSSRRTRRRRQQASFRRHQLRVEGLEKRYALDGSSFVGPEGWGWIGVSANTQVKAVAEDSTGAVYLAGTFSGTVDVDFSATNYDLVSNGLDDAFVAKYTEQGDFVWAKSFGSLGKDRGYTLAIASDDSIRLGGFFSETVDFDPGAGANFLTSAGAGDGFVLALDSAGNYQWAGQFGGTGTSWANGDGDFVNALVVDGTGNTLVGGVMHYSATASFGGETAEVIGSGMQNSIIMKIDDEGVLQWTKHFNSSFLNGVGHIAVAPNDDVIVGGRLHTQTMDADPGPGFVGLTNAGVADAYIVALDSEGAYRWAYSYGSTAEESTGGVTTDSLGNVYMVAGLGGTQDLDPGVGEAPFTADGNQDLAVISFDEDGVFRWAETFGGTGSVGGYRLIFGGSGDLVVSGFYETSLAMPDATSISNLVSNGSYDNFVLWLDAQTGTPQRAINIGTSGNENQTVTIAQSGSNGLLIGGTLGSGGSFSVNPEGWNFLNGDGSVLTVPSGGGGYLTRLVGEPTNNPPSNVTLMDVVNTIPETADTSSAIRIAGIDVTDDELGSNVVNLSGPDASSFYYTAGFGGAFGGGFAQGGVYLNPGIELDAISKPSFQFTVEVSDTSLPGSVPVTIDHTLNVLAEPTVNLFEIDGSWTRGLSPPGNLSGSLAVDTETGLVTGLNLLRTGGIEEGTGVITTVGGRPFLSGGTPLPDTTYDTGSITSQGIDGNNYRIQTAVRGDYLMVATWEIPNGEPASFAGGPISFSFTTGAQFATSNPGSGTLSLQPPPTNDDPTLQISPYPQGTAPNGHPLEASPEGNWLFRSGSGSGGTSYYPTTLDEVSHLTSHGYVTYSNAEHGWFQESGNPGSFLRSYETYIRSSLDQTISYEHGGNDSSALFIDDVFIGGAGNMQTVSGSLELTANVPVKLLLVGYDAIPGHNVWMKPVAANSLESISGIELSAVPFSTHPTIKDVVLSENAPEQTLYLAGISAGGGESQPLQVTATSDNESLIPNPTITYTSPNATGTLKFTPVSNQSGTATITVTVEDGGLDNDLATPEDNGIINRTVIVKAEAVNDVPTLNALSDVNVNEDAPEQTVNLTGITAGGSETQVLSITAVSDNTSLIPDPTVDFDGQSSTGTLKFTPVADQFGTATITVTVTDGGLDNDLATPEDNGIINRTVIVAVALVNDEPMLDALSDVNINEDDGEQTVNLTGIAAGGGETQVLSVTAVSDNTSLIPDPTVDFDGQSSTGTLKFTPVADQFGTATITVTVTDGGLDNDLATPADNGIVNRTVVVIGASVNDAPVLDPAASPQLHSVVEDAGIPVGQVGTLVSSLIDSGAPDNALEFPASVLPGTTTGNLPSGYETSGLTWHDGLQKLFAVSDESIVSMMNADGTELVNWSVPGDLEALTVADHTSSKIYIGVEHPDSILEFDVSTGQVTRTFELTSWMTGADSKGLEALAFVPDAMHPEGGIFYAGLQDDGRIYQFSLPIATSSSSTTVNFIQSMSIEGGSTDLAGLAYEPSSGQLLAMFDSIDQLNVIDRDGQLRSRWTVPGAGQEAVVFIDGHLYIGDDALRSITRYSGFDALINAGGVHNNFSDADGDLPGVAITGVNLQGGTLWYSIDDGAMWLNVGAVSDEAPRLLAADSTTRLYFEPAANFSGSISDVISFKAWDRTTAGWQQLGLDIDGETAGDNAGSAVSISADGRVIAVGAYLNDENGSDSGHVRIYSWDGSAWNQLGDDIDGNEPLDYFGYDVSLSADGQTVAIGAKYEYGDSNYNGADAGKVCIYSWDGSAWIQLGSDINGETADDHSGRSVSLSADGRTIVIGAYFNDSDGQQHHNSGHVRIYSWDGSAWNQLGDDIDGEAEGDRSGWSVSLAADGRTVAISAERNGGNGIDSGHVRIYSWDGINWNQLGEDIDGEAAGDRSGTSISLSADGHTISIGAYWNDGNGENAGHVRVYSWDGLEWNQMGVDIDAEGPWDRFGQSVSLSSDGRMVAIGEPYDDSNGLDSGCVRVYSWSGSAWTQFGLDLDGETAGDQFGTDVSFSADGQTVVMGAPLNDGSGNDSGHVRIFQLTPSASSLSTFIDTISIGVTPVNDVPTLEPLPDLSPTGRDLILPEDSFTQIINLTGISAGGGESQPLRVTALSSNPNIIPHPNVLYTSQDTTGSISFGPNANSTGPVTITVTVEDGGLDGDLSTTGDNATTSDSLNMYVRQLSDRPVLNTLPFSQSVQALANAEEPGGTVGILVSSLIDKDGPLSNFSDADSLDSPGIAITALNLQGGGLYYTEDFGTSWSGVESVNNASPLLLKADAATRLYYKPAENAIGRLENVLTYKAWDGNIISLTGLWTSFNARAIKLSSDNTKAFVSRSRQPFHDDSIPIGLVILDLSTPESPQVISRLDLQDNPSLDLVVSPDDNYVYLTEGDAGVRIVDVRDPSNPTLISTFDSSGSARRVSVSADGNKLFLLDNSWYDQPETEAGLRIIDVSNPSQPLLLGSYDLDGPAIGLKISPDESLAFIANGSNGIQVINITDSSNPSLAGSFVTEGWACDVTVSADQQTVYVADGPSNDDYYNTPALTGGLSIYNISDLSNVSLLGTFDTPHKTLAVELSVDERTAYVSDSGGGLLFVDIANPSTPIVKHVVDTWGASLSSATLPNRELLFVTTGDNGVEIINLDVANNISTASANVDVEVTVNSTPTGEVTVDGNPIQNAVLLANTSTIQDEDGLGEFSYQWLRDGIPISGASSSTHTLTQVDVGTQISVRINYKDILGTAENLTSAPTLVVVNVNDVPVLDTAASPQLTAINEDAAAPVGQVGTLVSALIDAGGTHNNFSDIDGDLPGVAITGTNLEGGTLWYSIDGGTTWSDVGAVSESSARLLHADSLTRLYYEPSADFHGSISDVITLRAWDRTGGYSNGDGGIDSTIFTGTGDTESLYSYAKGLTLSSDNTYAYVTDRVGLNVINIADRSNPVTVGFIETPGTSGNVVLSQSGNLAFVADSLAGVTVIDLTTSTSPTVIANTGLINDPVRKIVLSDDETIAYAACEEGTLLIVDVSDLQNLNIVNTVALSNGGGHGGLAISGNYMYVSSGVNGIDVLDISDPFNPFIDSTKNHNHWIGSLLISNDGQYLYAADNHLTTYDISSSGSLVKTSEIWIPKNAGGPNVRNLTLSSDGTILIAAASKNGIVVYDLSSPAQPQLISSLELSGRLWDVAISADDSHLFCAAGSSFFQAVDISTVETPTVISSVAGASDFSPLKRVTNDGRYEFRAWDDAVEVYDLSDSRELVYTHQISPGENWLAKSVTLSKDDRYAFVLFNGGFGTVIFDASNPLSLHKIGQVPSGGGLGDILLSADETKIIIGEDWYGNMGTYELNHNTAFSNRSDNVSVQVSSVNDDPTLDALSAINITEDDLEQTVNLTGITAGGGETQVLSVTAVSNNTGLIPNPSVTYTSADSTGSLAFTPVVNQHGTATITVTVTDGGLDNDLGTPGDNGVINRTVTVITEAVNDEPTLDVLSEININEDDLEQTVNLTGITAGGGESQQLEVTAVSDNTGLIPDPAVDFDVQSSTGTLKFTPVADQFGTATITVTVEDGGLDDDLGTPEDNGSVLRTVVVRAETVNDAPTLDALSDVTITEDDPEQNVSLTGITAGGGETQVLSVTATSDNTGLIPDPTVTYSSADSTATLKFTPVADQSGTATLTVTVEDGGLDNDLATPEDNGIINRTVFIAVAPTNDVPALDELSDVTITEDDLEQTVNVTGITAGGGETQALSITAVSDNTSLIPDPVVDFDGQSSTGTLKFTPVADQFGTATITVTLEDGGLDNDLGTPDDNGVINRTVVVKAEAVNDDPTLDELSDINITEDDPEQTINLTGITAGGGETQVLSITATSDNTSLIPDPTVTFDGQSSTGTLTFTPVADQFGTATITVTLEDGGLDDDLGTPDDNGVINRTVTVMTEAVNDDPTLDALSEVTINEDDSEQTINLAGITAGGGETQVLSVTATSDNTGLIPDPTVDFDGQSSTGTLKFTPVADQFGTATITVTVEDGGLDNDLGTPDDNGFINRTVTVITEAVNDEPTLNALSEVTINEDDGEQTINLAGITAGGGETQVLSITATSDNTGLIPDPTVTFDGQSSTGTLKFTPVANQFGTATITVTVEDSGLDNDLATPEDNGAIQRTVVVAVAPVNDTPTLDSVADMILPEDSLTQVLDITGITAGGSENQPLQVTALSSNQSLVLHPTVTSRPALGADVRLLTVTPLPDQYGIATITVTVEDGGLDLDLNTAEDNAIFSRSFDVTVTPDTDDVPSPVTPHGKMFIHETLSGDPLVSYQLPAVNVNGEAINGLVNRIAAASSDTALIPDPTVIYASADVPSSLSFTPVANANGTATLSIQVEDGGPDNNFATTEDNRQTTHQVEVNVLEVISNQGSAILAKDSTENLYVNTRPIVYHDQQQAQSNIAGFAAIGATSEGGENALLVERASVTNRLVTDDAWRINGLFHSLQNESSSVLDLTAREVSRTLNIEAVAGAYEINGARNPTLIVRRGEIYNFDLNVANHPFWLQTTGNGYQSENAFNRFFQGQGRTAGEYMWIVPADAPDEIFYQCEFHPVMFGKIIVID